MFKRLLLSLVVVSCSLMHSASDDFVSQSSQPEVTSAISEFFSRIWNSDSVSFVTAMINPLSYGRACKDMYNAGFSNAGTTLCADHKPVVAGVVLASAAVAATIAYSKGWFSKAKTWVSNQLN